MDSIGLGRLKRVDLREAWAHEALDFTPWLAREENLQLLGESVGIALVLQATEKAVGDFSADILALDVQTSQLVLIENQLEQTDHSHLGQILTYAAGLSAHTVIWVAREFREPHRAAIDFLNTISSEDYNFFAVQVELYQIGNSPLAPRFSVVAKPNEWSKRVAGKASQTTAAQDETRQQWADYWSAFMAGEAAKGLGTSSRTPPREGWFRVSNLRGGEAQAGVWLHWSKECLRVVLWLQGSLAKQLFDALEQDRANIDGRFGRTLVWDRMSDRKSAMIIARGPKPEGLTDEQQFKWFEVQAIKLREALRPSLDALSEAELSAD